MPLVPYAIHKTSYEFLDGKEEHPFLNCKLHKPAPSTRVFFDNLVGFLKGYEEDEIFDNIYMFYHNGDQFDVPFIDAELARTYEDNVTLRDFVQVYDTLPLSKTLVPSPVQKYIAHCQSNPVFLGDESTKEEKSVYIQPTQKNLDNVVRLAKFLIDFDPKKPLNFYNDKKMEYALELKNLHDKENVEYSDNLKKYLDGEINVDIVVGLNKKINFNLSEYNSFKKDYNEFYKLYNDINKSHPKVVKNLLAINETIKGEEYLIDALNRLNETNRDAHGARVDSQLFMDALIVIEGAFYPKPKLSLKNDRSLDGVPVTLTPESLNILKERSEPSSTDPEKTKEVIKKITKEEEMKRKAESTPQNLNNKRSFK